MNIYMLIWLSVPSEYIVATIRKRLPDLDITFESSGKSFDEVNDLRRRADFLVLVVGHESA